MKCKMSREKQKLTRAERIEQHKEDIKNLEAKKEVSVKGLEVDKERFELTEQINVLKKSYTKIVEGRPEYMHMQEFWDITYRLETLHYEHITKPQMDTLIDRAEDDIKGIDSALEYCKKEIEKESKKGE